MRPMCAARLHGSAKCRESPTTIATSPSQILQKRQRFSECTFGRKTGGGQSRRRTLGRRPRNKCSGRLVKVAARI